METSSIDQFLRQSDESDGKFRIPSEYFNSTGLFSLLESVQHRVEGQRLYGWANKAYCDLEKARRMAALDWRRAIWLERLDRGDLKKPFLMDDPVATCQQHQENLTYDTVATSLWCPVPVNPAFGCDVCGNSRHLVINVGNSLARLCDECRSNQVMDKEKILNRYRIRCAASWTRLMVFFFMIHGVMADVIISDQTVNLVWTVGLLCIMASVVWCVFTFMTVTRNLFFLFMESTRDAMFGGLRQEYQTLVGIVRQEYQALFAVVRTEYDHWKMFSFAQYHMWASLGVDTINGFNARANDMAIWTKVSVVLSGLSSMCAVTQCISTVFGACSSPDISIPFVKEVRTHARLSEFRSTSNKVMHAVAGAVSCMVLATAVFMGVKDCDTLLRWKRVLMESEQAIYFLDLIKRQFFDKEDVLVSDEFDLMPENDVVSNYNVGLNYPVGGVKAWGFDGTNQDWLKRAPCSACGDECPLRGCEPAVRKLEDGTRALYVFDVASRTWILTDKRCKSYVSAEVGFCGCHRSDAALILLGKTTPADKIPETMSAPKAGMSHPDRKEYESHREELQRDFENKFVRATVPSTGKGKEEEEESSSSSNCPPINLLANFVPGDDDDDVVVIPFRREMVIRRCKYCFQMNSEDMKQISTEESQIEGYQEYFCDKCKARIDALPPPPVVPVAAASIPELLRDNIMHVLDVSESIEVAPNCAGASFVHAWRCRKRNCGCAARRLEHIGYVRTFLTPVVLFGGGYLLMTLLMRALHRPHFEIEAKGKNKHGGRSAVRSTANTKRAGVPIKHQSQKFFLNSDDVRFIDVMEKQNVEYDVFVPSFEDPNRGIRMPLREFFRSWTDDDLLTSSFDTTVQVMRGDRHVRDIQFKWRNESTRVFPVNGCVYCGHFKGEKHVCKNSAKHVAWLKDAHQAARHELIAFEKEARIGGGMINVDKYLPRACAVLVGNDASSLEWRVNGWIYGQRLFVEHHGIADMAGTTMIARVLNSFVTFRDFKYDDYVLLFDDLGYFPINTVANCGTKGIIFRPGIVGEKIAIIGAVWENNTFKTQISAGMMGNHGLHSADTEGGWCTAPLIALRDGAVVGFHDAGSAAFKINRCIPILHEYVKLLAPDSKPVPLILDFVSQSRYPKYAKVVGTAKPWVGEIAKWLHPTYFENVGFVNRQIFMKNRRRSDPEFLEFQMTNPTVVETEEIWGMPSPNLPAAYKSLAKYGKGQPLLDEDCLMDAFAFLYREFGSYMCDSRITSYEEVVPKLDWTSSPGFPWNLDYISKKEVFENVPDFAAYAANCWEWLANDADYDWYWITSLKEEARPVEKIQKNSIRSFVASALEATVVGNRLFQDQNDKFYAAHVKTASAVGLNPFNGGWNFLYEHLARYAQGFELDESEYDSSLCRTLFENLANWRFLMLKMDERTPENYKRVQAYYTRVLNSTIVTPEGYVVRKKTGNPSGSINTIVDNTLLLYVMLAYAWLKLAPPEFARHEFFSEYVVLALTGDDNTWTVHPDIIGWYNARSVASVLSRMGVTTTSPCYDPRPLTELCFLSSSFDHFLRNKCVYHLEPGKSLKQLEYTTVTNDPVYTYERVLAYYRILWTDVAARRFVGSFLDFLENKYDDLLREDPRWRAVKRGRLSDYEYGLFYCDDLSGNSVKFNKPDKRDFIEVDFGLEFKFEMQARHTVTTKQEVKEIKGEDKPASASKDTECDRKRIGRVRVSPCQSDLRLTVENPSSVARDFSFKISRELQHPVEVELIITDFAAALQSSWESQSRGKKKGIKKLEKEVRDIKKAVVNPPGQGQSKKAVRRRQMKQSDTSVRTVVGRTIKTKTYAQELAVPRNEQDRLSTLVNAGGDDKIRGYVSAIVDPACAFDARVIDSFNTPTATFHSRRTFNVPVRLDTTSDSGRFSLLFQPFLGAIDTPEHYQMALSNPAIAWAGRDWTDPGSYTTIVEGSDIRVDVNYAQLTQQTAGFAGIYADGASVTAGFPFDVFSLDPFSYGLTVVSDPSIHALYLPIGQYMMSMNASTGDSMMSGTCNFKFTAHGNCNIMPVDSYSTNAPAGNPGGTACFLDFVFTVLDNQAYLEVQDQLAPAQRVWEDVNLMISPIQATIPVGTAPPTPAGGFTVVSSDYTGFAGGGGLINSYRPVACSVLVTYIGPLLTNGGNVSACWLPSNAADSNFFTRNPAAPGQFQNWEKLASVPTAYNGPISTGAYVYWTPEDITDVEMASLSEALNKDYPTLCVSGIFTPGTVVDAPTQMSVMRVQVDYCGEYVTSSTLVPSRACVGSQASWDTANMILANQPHAMPNGLHLGFISKIGKAISTAGKWAWKHRAALMAGAEGLAAIL